MDFLDLTRDDPDDAEGKFVTVERSIYQIGPCLGADADKIAYALANKKSGLCLHVITFWSGPAYESNQGPAHSESRGGVPNSHIVSGHGGTFRIHDYHGAFEDETSVTYRLWEKANGLLDASRFTEAATLLREVLRINPYHTEALHSLSYARRQLGDVERSRQLLSTVIEIEPNHVPYQQAHMQVAATCGYVRDSLEQFETMKTQFPYRHDCDRLAINLYLRSGRPEKAKAMLNQTRVDPLGQYGSDASILHPSEQARLQEETDAAIVAKEQARRIMARAEQRAQSRRRAGVLELLEEAYTIYDKDPFLVLNLAFALSRARELNRAGFLLVSVARMVPSSLAKVCYANSAFNEIKASRLDVAIPLLDVTASLMLEETPDHNDIDIHTLPGIGVWIGEQPGDEYVLVEERISAASELINRAVTQYARQVPPSVKRLAEWYRKAAG